VIIGRLERDFKEWNDDQKDIGGRCGRYHQDTASEWPTQYKLICLAQHREPPSVSDSKSRAVYWWRTTPAHIAERAGSRAQMHSHSVGPWPLAMGCPPMPLLGAYTLNAELNLPYMSKTGLQPVGPN
jgi:hypothetical protein